MRNRTLLIAVLATATLFGCKKKADEAPVNDKVVEPAGSGGTMAAPTPPATAPAAPAPAAAGAIATTDDYKARATALSAKLIAVVKDETDCDKLAANITGFVTSNKAETDAIGAWEKGHTDDAKAFEDTGGKAMMDAMKAPMDKCKDNAAFHAAVEKIPN